MAELRRLSEHCNFGDALEKALRDRIAVGIGDEAIQKKLLSEPDLTYDQAVLVAQGVETAGANLREMNKPLRPIKTEPVHRVRVYTERES